jgi:hypothetical protein
MIVVADTSPLNYLVLIDEVGLLPALFGQVLFPQAVFRELQHLAVGQFPGMDHPRLLTVGFSCNTNQPDQSNDGSIPIIDIRKAVLAGDADISFPVLPWVFAVVFAKVPFVAGRRQHLYFVSKAPYLGDFPAPYLIIGIELGVVIPCDNRKGSRNIRMALPYMIVPVRGGQVGFTCLLCRHLKEMKTVALFGIGMHKCFTGSKVGERLKGVAPCPLFVRRCHVREFLSRPAIPCRWSNRGLQNELCRFARICTPREKSRQ